MSGLVRIIRELSGSPVILYQCIGYGLLLLLIAGDEILDFPHTLFGAPATPINWVEVIIESSYVIVLGTVSVYVTYRNDRCDRHPPTLNPGSGTGRKASEDQ